MIVVAGRLGWWRAQIGIYTVNGHLWGDLCEASEKPDLSGGPGPTRQIRFFASFIQVTTPDRLEDPPQAFTEEMHQWVQPWGSKLQANSTRAVLPFAALLLPLLLP